MPGAEAGGVGPDRTAWRGAHREGWDNVLVGETGPVDPEARIDLDLDLHFGHIELRRR